MRSVEPYLRHILEEINFILQRTENVSFEDFEKNGLLTRACARSFEVIGEAAKQIPDAFKQSHQDIDWKGMAGMRDRLIHAYFDVNWNIVWAAVRDKLPGLKQAIERALSSR